MSIPESMASFSLVWNLCSCSGSHGISEVASITGGGDDDCDNDEENEDGASVSIDGGTAEAEEGSDSSSSLRRPSTTLDRWICSCR